MAHVALDADGFIVATHKGSGENPLEMPEGGSFSRVAELQVDWIESAWDAGKRARLEADNVIIEDHPAVKARAVAPDGPDKVRREKLRAIANEITKARDRGFAETDKYIPAKGLELARQVDVMWQVLTGKLNDGDTIWMRNWWTGHQEQITVAQWKAAMDKGFPVRQSLRQIEQAHRDQVEAIFNNAKLTDEEKREQIDAVVVPEYLDVDEKSTEKELSSKVQQFKRSTSESGVE